MTRALAAFVTVAIGLACDGGKGKGTGAGGVGGGASGGHGGVATGGVGGAPMTGGQGGTASGGRGGTGTGGLGSGGVGGVATGGAGGTGGARADAGSPGDAAADAGPSGVTPACTAMVDAAGAFLGALTPAQRMAAQRPWNDARKMWNYLPPGNYDGVQVGQLGAAARAAADTFLKTGLADRGFMKATVIQQIEAATQTGPYFLAVYGAPSATAAWGWRFQGHHLSLNFTVARCATIVYTTPAFMGANPSTGVMGGTAPLAAEEDLARQLVLALTPAQRTKADVQKPGTTTPSTPRVMPATAAGVLASDMTPPQIDQMRRLIDAYVGNMTPALAAARLAEIQDAGFDKVGFAWAGSTMPRQAYYYRVQGPTFLIEHDNTNGTHIHSVWRDFAGDFGPDALMQHYQAEPH